MTLEAHAKQTMTVTEFDAWTDQIGNTDIRYELISGEVYEVPSNFQASKIAIRIAGYIFMYLLQNDIGHLTGADGGYRVGDDRFIPDVAYISYTKQADAYGKGYNHIPPDLAIEVVSNSSNTTEWKMLLKKITAYLNAGTIVWVVDMDDKTVMIHQRDADVRTLGVDDMLEAETILPNFRLKVGDIFA